MILQYTLTPAPASQPRNVFFGTTIAGIISVLINMIDNNFMPHYIKICVGTATVAAVMARLAVQHPPAGATCIVYILNERKWHDIPPDMVLLVVAILLSMAVNNLSESRQYPTYWGFETSFLLEYPGILSCFRKKKIKSLGKSRRNKNSARERRKNRKLSLQ